VRGQSEEHPRTGLVVEQAKGLGDVRGPSILEHGRQLRVIIDREGGDEFVVKGLILTGHERSLVKSRRKERGIIRGRTLKATKGGIGMLVTMNDRYQYRNRI
jgi:hypothetical protein